MGFLDKLFGGKKKQEAKQAEESLKLAEEAAKQGYIGAEDIDRIIRFRNAPDDESWRK